MRSQVRFRKALLALACFWPVLLALPLSGTARATEPMGIFRSHGQLAVRAPVFCTDSALNDQLTAQNLVITADMPGTGKLPPGRVTNLRPAEPDDLPMEIDLLVPRDRTMQSAHDKVMETVGSLGAVLASLGHRNHTIRLFTYHACQGETQNTPGNVVVEDHGSFPTQGDGPTRLQETATDIRRAGGLCKPAEFTSVMETFLRVSQDGDMKDTGQQRFRLLAVLHDGTDVAPDLRDIQKDAPSAAEAELASALRERFQRVLIIQPDIAPTVLRRYSSRLLKLAAVRRHIVALYVDELEGECISEMGSGADACISSQAKKRREAQAEALASAVGKVQLTSGMGRTFVSRASLVALVAGAGVQRNSDQWAITARQINAAFPRPSGLDCFGAYLASEGLGALVLLGGIQSNRPMCKGFDEQAPVAPSFADAFLRSSPFNGAKIADICFGSVPGTTSGGSNAEARYDVSIKQPEGNQIRCTSGHLRLSQSPATSPVADQAVAAVCQTREERAQPPIPTTPQPTERPFSLFFVVLTGCLGIGLGLGAASVFRSRGDD